MNEYTKLDEMTLSDGSKVYNIRLFLNNSIIHFDCISQDHAIELQREIEECSSINDGT